jgi:hypothetical protein
MGTYLATGIIKNITIPKKHISYKEVTIDHILTSLKNELNLDYYTFEEDANNYYWEIQPRVLEDKLADFLTTQFEMYQVKRDKYMEEAISKIEEASSGQGIIDLSCSKKLIQFQLVDGKSALGTSPGSIHLTVSGQVKFQPIFKYNRKV